MFNALTSVDSTQLPGRTALLRPEQYCCGITLSTLEEEGKAAEGRRGNEGRGEERGNLRSDYSGEEEEEYKEEEGKGKYARGRQSRNGACCVRADDGHNRVFTSRHPTTVHSQNGGSVA